MESANAFPYLQPLLDDPSPDVRVQAVLAVTRCVPEKVMEILPSRISGEANPVVLATLISSLGETGKTECRELIGQFLDNSDSRVVANAIDSLQKLCEKTPSVSITKKVETYLSHEDNRVKSNAIKALWHWKQYNVLDDLKNLLSKGDAKNQLSAIFVLGEIGHAISLDAKMVKAVNDGRGQSS
ncbi:HEAT repeat domain-containing protein [bacterium]|nr:HEAT repeat domain-containing protein [bacterium]